MTSAPNKAYCLDSDADSAAKLTGSSALPGPIEDWATRLAIKRTPSTSSGTTAMASSSTSVPTTRSRTLLFLSFRDSRASSTRFRRPRTPIQFEDVPGEDEQDRLISPEAAHVAIDAELPPRWLSRSVQIEACWLTHSTHPGPMWRARLKRY